MTLVLTSRGVLSASLALVLTGLTACSDNKKPSGSAVVMPQVTVRCSAEQEIRTAMAKMNAREITLADYVHAHATQSKWMSVMHITGANSADVFTYTDPEYGYVRETDKSIAYSAVYNSQTKTIDTSITCAYLRNVKDGVLEQDGSRQSQTVELGSILHFDTENYSTGKVATMSIPTPLELGNHSEITVSVKDETASEEEMKAHIQEIQSFKNNPAGAIKEGQEELAKIGGIKFYRGQFEGKTALIFHMFGPGSYSDAWDEKFQIKSSSFGDTIFVTVGY